MENYAKRFEEAIGEARASGKRPRLLLHACCAPCSSHCLEVLAEVYEITVFFYNPNIAPEEEHAFRLSELKRFVGEAGYRTVAIDTPEYDPAPFEEMAKGLESLPEGGERCRRCYALRLRRTAEAARDGGFDAFTTTLSISPHKNAAWLNEIGLALSEEFGVPWLCSDFKKKDGYKRSIQLSAEYGLYRQDYCGCRFSREERERKNREKAKAE
ncbi:MAG: epoxyqueuosine reductase QueH [Clostridia bacterium]|nr:epoxyqueuosine reductase QueH [Clostridia bacterium]